MELNYLSGYLGPVALLIVSYLLGSLPTALIVSKKVKGVDIRTIGDGNMGATNTFRTLGEKAAIVVAVVDFSKGALAVLIAHLLGLSLGWKILAGIFTIMGHDFPIFAGFKGGQGTATTLGVMLITFPTQALIGLIVYGVFYLITKKSSLSCGIGGGLIALLLGLSHQWLLLIYAVALFLLIPFKKFLDTPRRRAIEAAQLKHSAEK